MSDEDKDSKTEDASPRKLAQALEKGDLPIGKDASTVASLAFGFLTLLSCGNLIADSLVFAVTTSIKQMSSGIFQLNGDVLFKPLAFMALVGGAAALGAASSTMAQTKGQVWPEKLTPDIKKCFSLEKITKIFKTEFLTDLGMTILKVAGIMSLAIWCLYDDFVALIEMYTWPQNTLLTAVVDPLASMIMWIIFAMIVIAVFDYVITYKRFMDKMKMSVDELKREFKEDMGDPMIRARRKQKAREISQNRVNVEVPKADALIVNPTHIAIAIRYERGTDNAPRITAKGKDNIADLMRKLARENNVPIVKDVPLARLLYKKVKVGKTVPAETYKAVAAVLAFVYRVTGRLPGMRQKR
jgi:flagellar biosynthesis protein FlhB